MSGSCDLSETAHCFNCICSKPPEFPPVLPASAKPGATSHGGDNTRCAACATAEHVCCACWTCSLSKRFYLLRRTAVSAVVTLMSGSRKNQLLLLSRHSQAYHTLMSRVLPQCGDAATQVGIMHEGLASIFRCETRHMRGMLCFACYSMHIPGFSTPGMGALHKQGSCPVAVAAGVTVWALAGGHL